jgi:hypothetical protein
MQPALLGLFHLLTLPLLASCLHSPLSWSPDGRWLVFTVAQRSDPAASRPAQAFDPLADPAVGPPEVAQGPAEGSLRYRIWAAERATANCVMVEEAPYPLSAPVWGPDGHTLAYARFIPHSPVTGVFPVRGRYELVLQEALDRKRVIATFENVDLYLDELASLPELEISWSPDGEFLAVPRPGRTPSVAIVRVDRGFVQKTIASASRPSWSPDGSRLAYLVPGRGGPLNQYVQVVGRDFRQGHALIELSQVNSSLEWSLDRQSLLVVCRRAQSRGREIELIRIAIDSGDPSRALTITMLPPENLAASRTFSLETDDRDPFHLNRVSIAFDREQEQCVFATDIQGQPPQIKVANISRRVIIRPFHPLDITIRMGALALAPDGQTIAVRMNSAGKAALPLFCDLGTEAVRFIIPDSSIRREWALTLAHAAQALLQAGLQEPTVDGQRVHRATLLPIRGEIPDHSPVISRIRHLGKVGRGLLDQSIGQQSTPAGEDSGLDEPLDEYRLFFDYLREDYASAESDLEALEPRASTADRRLLILGLRAQILQAQGQLYRAKPIVDYLIRLQGAQPRCIEDTPLGPVLSPPADPRCLWPTYLSQFMTASKSWPGGSPGEEPDTTPPSPHHAIPGGPAFGADLLPGLPDRFGVPGFDPRRMGGGPFRPDHQPGFFPPPAPPRPVDPALPRIRRPATDR